jgi:signal transduction histidine kinase
MIKKLRRKFVVIIMALVSAVLMTVFITLCASTYTRLRMDTETAARLTLENGNKPDRFRPEIAPGRPRPGGDVAWNIPTFYVRVSADGRIVYSDYGRVSITDETAREAVSAVLNAGESSGVLGDLELRYVSEPFFPDNETAIAFADTSSETNGMRRIVINSLAIGGGGLILLFFISLLLARLTIKPVEKAWQVQQQFIADASHELKTPLTVIMANTDIIAAHPETQVCEQMQWLRNNQNEAARMKKLVENMLELARGDFSQESLVFSSINVSDIVTNSLLSFEPLAFECNVTIADDTQPDLTILGNAEKIRRLCAILLDNAIKYAGGGGSVNLTLRRSGAHILLSVRNSGTAIPAERLPRIFDRFYRADPSRSSGRGSSFGLGLSIAKQIADEHGAKIHVTSSNESGTVFSVQLRACRQ